MKEFALERQIKINSLLSELLIIKNELDSKLKDLTPEELDNFETFVCTDPKWWDLEEIERELRNKLEYN